MPADPNRGAAQFVPGERTLAILGNAIQRCRGCDLYRSATQAVFGELETGHQSRKYSVAIMIIGEQPGDQEDKQGRPFVGPAGKLLDKCLGKAGIDRRTVYITNTVKHFKWEPRGKMRIHKKPTVSEGPCLQTVASGGTRDSSPEVDHLSRSGCCTVLDGLGF